jgi:hypothetical protein
MLKTFLILGNTQLSYKPFCFINPLSLI